MAASGEERGVASDGRLRQRVGATDGGPRRGLVVLGLVSRVVRCPTVNRVAPPRAVPGPPPRPTPARHSTRRARWLGGQAGPAGTLAWRSGRDGRRADTTTAGTSSRTYRPYGQSTGRRSGSGLLVFVSAGPVRGAGPGPGEGGRHACLVSQKILEISSIFASSWSATAGSAEPLAPLAPASLVASLNSWCSCGYFSKWTGLK
jgi:hypothetical protein